MSTIERRYGVRVEARSNNTSDSPGTVRGYASVFNSLYNLGDFWERVSPGAFDRTLAKNPDVRFLYNHNTGAVCGRTSNGTLRLAVDNIGLRCECDMPNTTWGKDLLESVKRGDINAMSFGFTVDKDDWDEEDDPEDRSKKAFVRTIRTVGELFEVSAVAFPASPSTTISLAEQIPFFNSKRSAQELFPQGVPAELRTRVHLRRQLNHRDFANRVLSL